MQELHNKNADLLKKVHNADSPMRPNKVLELERLETDLRSALADLQEERNTSAQLKVDFAKLEKELALANEKLILQSENSILSLQKENDTIMDYRDKIESLEAELVQLRKSPDLILSSQAELREKLFRIKESVQEEEESLSLELIKSNQAVKDLKAVSDELHAELRIARETVAKLEIELSQKSHLAGGIDK